MDTVTTQLISDYLSGQPVVKAWVFGSYARGEEQDDSDIDLIVRFDRTRAKVGLFKYATMMLELENLLHRPVDLVEEGALLPYAERTAQQDKQLIYERNRP